MERGGSSEPASGLAVPPDAPGGRGFGSRRAGVELLLERGELRLVALQPCSEPGELGLKRCVKGSMVGALALDLPAQLLDDASSTVQLEDGVRELSLELLDAPCLAVPGADGERCILVAPRPEPLDGETREQDRRCRVERAGCAADARDRSQDDDRRHEEDERL